MLFFSVFTKGTLSLPLSPLQDDDAELAKQLAALKWHEKELEVSSNNSATTIIIYMYKLVWIVLWYYKVSSFLPSPQLRNKTLVQDIREEEDEIMQIKVKLKVLPLKQKLSIDE